MVIVPADHGRQRHQDGLGPPRRFQAEDRAPIIKQIELNVSAAAKLLESPFALPVKVVLTAPGNGQVRFQEGITSVPDESEQLVEIPLQVVKEDSTDAARFGPMRE